MAPAALAQTDPMRAAMEKQKAALARQTESIRQQAQTLGVWLLPMGAGPAPPLETAPAKDGAAPAAEGASPTPEMPCDAIEDAAVSPIIEAAAKTQALEPKLLRAVIEQESAYRPCAVSPKGAQGLMQLMPETAGQLGVLDVFDPKQNVEAGAKYLKQLLDRYGGDLAQALGAYNAGPGTVDQAGGVPQIPETKDYVKAILQKINATGIPPPQPGKD